MKLTAFGSHTAPYGEFPYGKMYEFERILHGQFSAIDGCTFTSIDTMDVLINSTKVGHLNVAELHAMVQQALNAASNACDWIEWRI